MKKFHLAICTHDLTASVEDYSQRLGQPPQLVVEDEYALWRTDSLNVSLRYDQSCSHGEVRHLGWEDETATEFSSDTDSHGILWERFSFAQQSEEIKALWPEAKI